MKKLPELLVPAGSLEVFETAIDYGADAIYIGGDVYSLRAKAKNFDINDMRKAISLAHSRGVKLYITANILAHNTDIEQAYDYYRELKELAPDGIIIADPGMFMIAKEVCKDIELHISTQANNTNYMTYRFWHDMGAKRVVCARELTLKEIREIADKIPKDMEIEAFVHGSMCISYSGRCLMSNFFTGRDANKGECTHPCRWQYHVVEETRPGEYMPIYENERGTYLFNSKDLSMIEHIPELIEAGINSLKIEGRMKPALYVATVTRTYRMALDDYSTSPQLYYDKLDWYKSEIGKCSHREFTTGFYFDKNEDNRQIYDANTYIREYIYIGKAEEIDANGLVHITQKNKFLMGDKLEIMCKNGNNVETVVKGIYDDKGNSMECAPHPLQNIRLDLTILPEVGDILRLESA